MCPVLNIAIPMPFPLPVCLVHLLQQAEREQYHTLITAPHAHPPSCDTRHATQNKAKGHERECLTVLLPCLDTKHGVPETSNIKRCWQPILQYDIQCVRCLERTRLYPSRLHLIMKSERMIPKHMEVDEGTG